MSELNALTWIFPMDSKVDAIMPDGTHQYWSTHCRHEDHDACSASIATGQWTHRYGRAGPRVPAVTIQQNVLMERRPAQCKHCSAPCICPCHKSSTEEEAGR